MDNPSGEKFTLSFLNYQEAADYLGLKCSTLYALVAQRRVPHIRIGPRFVRFYADELDAWIAKKRVEPEKSGSSTSSRTLRKPAGAKS